jgi:Tfp pilus assembly protein PilV
MIEVVVSLLLLVTVMTAALSLFVHSLMGSSLYTERHEAGVLASAALENVRTAPVASLVAGRTQASVDALWAAPGVVSTSGTVKAYDATATTSSTPTFAPTSTTTVNNTAYTVKIFIDTCYASSTVTGTVSCTGTTSSSTTAMYRVSIGVTWTPGRNQRCSTAGQLCGYAVSTLIDPSSDSVFNVTS